MIILWIIISIIFLTSRSLEVEIRPYSGKRPHEAHDRIVGYKKNIPNAGLKSDQSNQTSIIKEPLNKEISNKESIPNEKFKSYQQNRTADEDTKDEKINRKESITLEGIEAILGNQTLDNATLNLEIHNERSPNKEFKLKSTNQTFFNALNEEMGKKRKVRSIFYIPEPRKRKPSKPNNKALNKRKSKSNKPLPVKKKADHEKQKQIISTTAKPSNQTLDKNILNKGMNNTKNTTTRGTETDQRYKLLGYDALNGAVGNKKCIKWGTIPSTGLLSDYFIYVGAYIHPRPSREYVAFFDGILLQNNVALTNVMFNSTVLTQIRRTRSEGFTVLNAVDYQATPDIKKTRFIYDAKNYDEWLNSVNDIDKFQRIPSNKKGVQLALIKLNQSYDIEVKTLLLGRPLNKKDRCVVFLRMKSEIKAIPIKMYSRDECKKQQPEYEEGTCFSNADEQKLACNIKPGAPIFCSGFLAGIVRWTSNCSVSKSIPYADTYKYLQWITQMTDKVHKSDNCPTITKELTIHGASVRLQLRPSLFYLYKLSYILSFSYFL